MLDDRFIFVLSALFGIAMWVFIAIRHHAVKYGRKPTLPSVLIGIVVSLTIAVLIVHLVGRWNTPGGVFPSIGSVLACIIGAAVGSFSARFIWSLFGARFGAKDPVIGVLVLFILVVVYSLPVYRNEFAPLLSKIGLSSVKTPIVEFTFTEHSPIKGAVKSARAQDPSHDASPIPRPSDPRPGLTRLKLAVSDYPTRDAEYVRYFEPKARDQFFPKKFLRPAETLAACLEGYVEIFPDSQLLLVDIKPVIQFLFRMHRNAFAELRKDHWATNPKIYLDEFNQIVRDIRTNVFEAFGFGGHFLDTLVTELPQNDGTKTWLSLIGYNQRKLNKDEIRSRLLSLGAHEDQVKSFVDYCSDSLVESKNYENDAEIKLSYLQPYVTMALANLLVAHGSPDEAVEVLTQWLDLWRCARGGGQGRDLTAQNCAFSPIPDAADLPEWFAIRAEFELSVLLYRLAGEGNITYHNFLAEHVDHFRSYVAQPTKPAAEEQHQSLSIAAELQRCLDKKKFDEPAGVRPVIFRSLVQNEHTLLRSELHFLEGLSWAEMENLFQRVLALTQFRIDCVYHPEEGSDSASWEPVLAEYKVTAGLLGLAIADRITTTAESADLRSRADDIRKLGKEQLFVGYRILKKYRDQDRRNITNYALTQRVFAVSAWEESCALAERAIYQLSDTTF